MSIILLVEDNATFRKWIKDILLAKFPGMGVLEAAEGQQAVKTVRNSCPDVVVMDIGLPGKNGLEVTKEIREECPLQKVMFLTNYNEPEFRQAAEEIGVDCFLDKGTTRASNIVGCVSSLLSEE